MRLSLVIAIPGWRDADLALEAIRSARPYGRVVYLDGAYRTYYDGPDWQTPVGDTLALAEEADCFVCPSRPWETEAQKKTALVNLVRQRYDPEWILFLDADERLEGSGLSLHRCDEQWYYLALSQEGATWKVPRLIRMSDDLHFRPPRDFEAWRGDARTAPLEGEPGSELGFTVDPKYLRIRHDRHLRPVDRMALTRRYILRRDKPERWEERLRADGIEP